MRDASKNDLTIHRDVLTVLLEATPRDVDYNQLKLDLEEIPGIHTVHFVMIYPVIMN